LQFHLFEVLNTVKGDLVLVLDNAAAFGGFQGDIAAAGNPAGGAGLEEVNLQGARIAGMAQEIKEPGVTTFLSCPPSPTSKEKTPSAAVRGSRISMSMEAASFAPATWSPSPLGMWRVNRSATSSIAWGGILSGPGLPAWAAS
jgi:hypothetical protein